MLKLTRTRKGYMVADLYLKGRARQWRVHILVMLAFAGPCPPGHEVNHRDGCKHNNSLTNLEYVTHPENESHAARTGLKATGERHSSRTRPERVPRGSRHGNAVLSEALVREIRCRIAAGEQPPAIARQLGVGRMTVYNVHYGRTWKHVV